MNITPFLPNPYPINVEIRTETANRIATKIVARNSVRSAPRRTFFTASSSLPPPPNTPPRLSSLLCSRIKTTKMIDNTTCMTDKFEMMKSILFFNLF